jgi:hypothetical protein
MYSSVQFSSVLFFKFKFKYYMFAHVPSTQNPETRNQRSAPGGSVHVDEHASVRAAAEDLAERHMVLDSRCYEHERIPNCLAVMK